MPVRTIRVSARTWLRHCQYRQRSAGDGAPRLAISHPAGWRAAQLYGPGQFPSELSGVVSPHCQGQQTMKAVYIEEFGGPEVLKYGDLPDPSAGPGQIVVDAFAASVNAADWKVRAGQHGPLKFPLIPGRDFSGVVSALGSGVEDLRIGDEVFGVLEAGRAGGYAVKFDDGASRVATN